MIPAQLPKYPLKPPAAASRSHSQAHPEPCLSIPQYPAPPFSPGKRHHFQPGLTIDQRGDVWTFVPVTPMARETQICDHISPSMLSSDDMIHMKVGKRQFRLRQPAILARFIGSLSNLPSIASTNRHPCCSVDVNWILALACKTPIKFNPLTGQRQVRGVMRYFFGGRI